MKAKVFTDRVDLLLISERSQNSLSLRQTLCDLEFRNIRTGSTNADILKALETRAPDLMIADFDLSDGDVTETIRDIRHHRVGTNPFMSIIVTTWEPSDALVRQVIDCGADDLLVQPTSRKQLSSRIDVLTFNRKPFVVTSGYIGPDRRAEERPGRKVIEPREVPNALRARVTGEDNSGMIQQEIDRAVRAVNHEKLLRNAAHIGYMVQQILAAHHEGKTLDVMDDMVTALITTAEDASRRLADTKHASVSTLCESVVQVGRRLEQSLGTVNERDLRLLPQLAMSIRLALKSADDSADTANEISRVVYGARRASAV